MDLQQYLSIVEKRHQSGISSEHSFRADLEALIRSLVPDVEITNEPLNVTDCGNPDYVITKGKIPIGFIEAKDLNKDLNHKQYKPQFDRYRKALDNLIITDYLWFRFYQNGKLVHEIRIADIDNEKIVPLPDNFNEFTNLIQNFCTFVSQTIKSPKKLAEMMAAKARLLENILENAVTSDEKTEENSALQQQYKTFKSILIHDLTPHGFADIYAQTLAYGMFAARLHDKTLDTFSRQEAAELIPKSNPFLRKLFDHVAGVSIDERIKTTVDNLAEVFRATNVDELLKKFGTSTQTQDPIIHFYETFLAEYDPKLRKSRGVWYTPEPVVKFIVSSVDEILKTEFGIKDGLADIAKTKIKFKTDKPDRRTKSGYVELDKEVHKVQVLDPATGTGTFLAEVIRFIYQKKFKTMQGAWGGYVEEHLIPRLNGFELLMASYSMAHLKLDMLLTETGFKPKKNKRFNIFLTNSLEEHHPDTGTLFSSWLSTEANEANTVKRDTPVMVVMGNPPYSGESANKGEWIMDLMDDYKKEPGGKDKLKERNPKWINDDYVKFIRYGQHFIEKNGEGVLAYINPHGFLDNPTFRGMRWNLLKTYDKIYTIDLHGNSKKKETAPDGTADINVFDIQQGVAVTFFIKTSKKESKELAKVHHFDVYGTREHKYQFLLNNTIRTVPFNQLPNIEPMYFMVQKDFKAERQYSKGFNVKDIFLVNNVGIVTSRDALVIDEDKQALTKRIKDFFELPIEALKSLYSIKENKNWNIEKVRTSAKRFFSENIQEIDYRPYDKRFIYYKNEFIERSRKNVMQHFLQIPDSADKNLGMITVKRVPNNQSPPYIFITNNLIVNGTIRSDSVSIDSVYPLYLYPERSNQQTIDDEPVRRPNLDLEIIEQISNNIGLSFVNEKDGREGVFAPIDIFDYIYAVLHSPNYREKYKEFLKIDIPSVPYPKDVKTFWALVKLGSELRKSHLLDSGVVENYITSYPIDGDNTVTHKITKKDWELYDSNKQLGRIWINGNQYFEQIPLKAWEFYIGGYQPAQKWLKDRTGRKLSFDDILHYQKIIVSLTETDRIMQEINLVKIE